jgi:predicted amidohydrolase
MQNLTVTLIQTELVWEKIEANLTHFTDRIAALEGPTDLIILPEMFSTGFSMNAPALAEPMDGAAATWIRDTSVQKGVVITGSLMIRENGRYYNRLLWATPDGTLSTYDKRHLFRYAGEEKVYTAGNKRLTVELKGWNIRPFICYDLRFPIWTRNLGPSYDLAFFVANWPATRASHWRTLLRARAIENQAYVIGVNRVGTDGSGLDFSGHSAIIDPLGNVLFEQAGQVCSPTVCLEYEILETYRRRFPAWMDSDVDML